MKKTSFLLLCLCFVLIYACDTTQSIQVTDKTSEVNDDMTWGVLDTIDGADITDDSGQGVFGRKIIYRDLSATKVAINFSGTIITKVCINREGIVTYAELLSDGTTIRDKSILKKYVYAARGYKFEPNLSAPSQQCGRLKFGISNTVYNKLK